MSLATLGPITFVASADLMRTFDEAKRKGAARWHEHAVHLAQPKLEFLGPGIDEITLSVRLDIKRGVVPRDELRTMRTQRDAGNVMALIVGGDYAGDFVLVDLNETWKHFDANGVLTLASVDLSIKEYIQ